MAKKPLFLTYAEPSPEVLQGNQWYHRMRNPIPQQLLGVRLKPGGVMAKKPLFLTYAVPLRYKGTNGIIGCAIQFRNNFWGLGGPVKSGGSYGQKTTFSHICRAFP